MSTYCNKDSNWKSPWALQKKISSYVLDWKHHTHDNIWACDFSCSPNDYVRLILEGNGGNWEICTNDNIHGDQLFIKAMIFSLMFLLLNYPICYYTHLII